MNYYNSVMQKNSVHYNGIGYCVKTSSIGKTIKLYDSLNLKPTDDFIKQIRAIYPIYKIITQEIQ